MQPVITRIHDLAGDLVLDLSPANGYRRVLVTPPGAVLQRTNDTSSAYVDGDTEVTPATRSSLKFAEQIKVRGTPGLTGDEWDRSVYDRIQAIIDAAATTRFLWVVSTGGYLWTYRTVHPASVDPTVTRREDLVARQQRVLLTFTGQPNPTRVEIGDP
jgi:hypothetical protein